MISVCIATFNGEQYIREQLDSILMQLNIDDEIIVSDDHSDDRTLEIISSYNDDRIKIFHNLDKGIVKNFENAIKQSTGDYIFLSDQDDIWMDNKIEVCLSDFNKGYDVVITDCVVFDSETKQVLQESFFTFYGSQKGVLKNIMKNSYIGCCMSFNRRVKDRIMPFPKLIPMHDSWIGLIGELHFKVHFNSNKLIRYRMHSKNASYTGSGKSKYSIVKKASFRLNLIYSIIINYLKF